MTTNQLAKYYEKLTPEERIPLVMSAVARGDEQEKMRLLSSTPCVVLRVPDTYPSGSALRHLSAHHRMELLELALRFIVAMGMASLPGRDEFLRPLRLYGYLFRTEQSGWKRFCEARHFNPTFSAGHFPGDDVVQKIDETICEEFAMSHAEALAFVREQYRTQKCRPRSESTRATRGGSSRPKRFTGEWESP